MIPMDWRAPFIQQRWVELYNGGAYEVPAFGVCEITGAQRPENINNAQSGGRTVLNVTRPTEDSPNAVCLNGPIPIAVGAYGFGTLHYPAYAKYATADTPVAGEEWGAAKDSFELTKGRSGFVILGDASNGIVRVDAFPATTSVIHFELTSTLALSGDAEAIILSDDGADWADTAVAIQVYDWFATEGMWAGIAGYRGYAVRRDGLHASGRQKYDVLWMEQIAQTIQFTSTEYMGATTASRMAVTVNWYDHQGKEPTGSVIVRDPQGQFPDVHSGAKGTAVYDYRNGYYRVVSCQRVALFASASLTADSCASSMSIDGFAVKATGDYVGSPPTAPTAPSNTCGHAGLDNDVVLLRRVNNTMPQPAWEVVDVTKHSKVVMTDVQVSGLTLQKKEITIYVEVCTTTAPSWATWHTGGECP